MVHNIACPHREKKSQQHVIVSTYVKTLQNVMPLNVTLSNTSTLQLLTPSDASC